MVEPVLTNLIKNGKNKFMEKWMKKVLPHTQLKGSRMVNQVYEDIRKGNPDLAIGTLKQNMRDWNMTNLPLMANKRAYAHDEIWTQQKEIIPAQKRD